MSYIITTKIEVVGGEITRTPIAFLDTEANSTTFSTWCSFDEWVENNKVVNGPDDITLPNHTDNPCCYEGNIPVSTIDNMNLTLVETL